MSADLTDDTPRCHAPADAAGFFRCGKPAGHVGDRHHVDFAVGSYTWGYVADAVRTEMTTDATQTSYARAALDALAAELPGEDLTLLRLYTLLALTKGRSTTLEDVHDAWALWRLDTRPDHPSLVPFADLPPDVQELDRPYMEAIHRAAEALPTPGQGDGPDGAQTAPRAAIQGIRIYRPGERQGGDPDRPIRIEIAGVAYIDLAIAEVRRIIRALADATAVAVLTGEDRADG